MKMKGRHTKSISDVTSVSLFLIVSIAALVAVGFYYNFETHKSVKNLEAIAGAANPNSMSQNRQNRMKI